MGVIYYGLPQRLTLSVWLPQRISYETVRCKGREGDRRGLIERGWEVSKSAGDAAEWNADDLDDDF